MSKPNSLFNYFKKVETPDGKKVETPGGKKIKPENKENDHVSMDVEEVRLKYGDQLFILNTEFFFKEPPKSKRSLEMRDSSESPVASNKRRRVVIQSDDDESESKQV
jgi:hypothetical protein